MGVGRFICITVPLALTIGSLLCIIIVETAQITNKGLYFAKFDTANLSVSAASLVSRDLSVLGVRGDLAHLTSEALSGSSSSDSSSGSGSASGTGIAHLHTEALSTSAIAAAASGNLTASDLGLADSYTVGLWSYCSQTNNSKGSVTQKCSSPKAEYNFDPFSIWNLSDTTAESAINSTTLNDALKAYKKASKWTWIVYIIALVFTILELLFGIVAIFSRIGSTLTTIASTISSIAIIAASILATTMWSIIVATFNKELKPYGLHATVSTQMLAVTWLAVAFSLAGGFFWLISICCCGSTHKKHMNYNRGPEQSMPMSLPYQKVPEPAFASGAYAQPTAYNNAAHQGFGNTEYGPTSTGANAKPIRDLETAYEPYRHGNL